MRLVVEAVSKRYSGDLSGLRDFSIDLERGVVGLLGPNGAGKSNLMRVLATITRRRAGRCCGTMWTSRESRRRCGLRSATCRRISACIHTSRRSSCSST